MKTKQTLADIDQIFFIGIAGVGMSALAQYLQAEGKQVSGSDRYFEPGLPNETRQKLEAAGIACFEQNGSGIGPHTQWVVASTAVEDQVPEMLKARELNIPVMRRSELLAIISNSKRTIAVGGTSGKSSSSAMLFQILEEAGMEPGIISGAGLQSLIKKGKIGNAKAGAGEWLIIEADESDGSIVNYQPEVGLLLNIDKDHQSIDELIQIFTQFKANTKNLFIVNSDNILSGKLSANAAQDFSTHDGAGFIASGFKPDGFSIHFSINGQPFELQQPGEHSMYNALAATAVAAQLGVSLQTCANALRSYEGIYRRHQLIGQKNGVWVVDDYAHNPAKCAASIAACQHIAPKVIAWFQPHGYGPTRFLKQEFIEEIAAVLRPQDEIWMSEIFYAGGTATKDISANDLIKGIQEKDKQAFFVADRNDLSTAIHDHLEPGSLLLLMGARDPSLEKFAQEVFENM